MSRVTATTLVPIQQSTGMELTAHMTFEKRPMRLDLRLETLKKYVAKYPSGWKKRLELAEVLYYLGQWNQAAQEYRFVLDRQPHLLNVRLQLGKILQLLNQSREAIAIYRVALDPDSDAATYHHIQGLIHECKRCDTSATLAFKKAVDLEAENTAHWYALAQTYVRQDGIEDAIKVFDHILRIQPEDTSALNQSADLLWRLGAYTESIKRTEQVLTIAPDHVPALKRMVDHRCRTGALSGEAGKFTACALKRLKKLAPHAPEIFQSQAYFHLYKGNVDRGKALLEGYCQEHSQNPFGLYYNALFLFHIGEVQASAESIWQAYQLYPEDRDILRALCKILPAAKQYSRLEKPLEQMLQQFPKQWCIAIAASRVFVESHCNIQRGCQLAENAVQLHPQRFEPWFQYGQILALSQKHTEAIEAIATGWRSLPKQWFCASSVPAAVQMAECYQALGQEEEAQHWWQVVLMRSNSLNASFPRLANYWQGCAHRGLGNDSTALKYLSIDEVKQLPYTYARKAKMYRQEILQQYQYKSVA